MVLRKQKSLPQSGPSHLLATTTYERFLKEMVHKVYVPPTLIYETLLISTCELQTNTRL